MTIYKLISEYYKHRPDEHYFDRDSLRFFGERLSEMYVLKNTTIVNGHECYIVSSIQRPPYGKPYRHHAYFDTKTYERILMED